MVEPSPFRDGERRSASLLSTSSTLRGRANGAMCCSVKLSQPPTESYSTFRTTVLYEGGPNLLNGAVLWNRNMYLHGKLCSSQWDSSGLNLELGGFSCPWRLLSDQQEVFLISSCRQMALRADCTRQVCWTSQWHEPSQEHHLYISQFQSHFVPSGTRLTKVFIVLLVASDSPNRFWTKVPGLWSSEQVRDLQTENRQDDNAPSKFHWLRSQTKRKRALTSCCRATQPCSHASVSA